MGSQQCLGGLSQSTVHLFTCTRRPPAGAGCSGRAAPSAWSTCPHGSSPWLSPGGECRQGGTRDVWSVSVAPIHPHLADIERIHGRDVPGVPRGLGGVAAQPRGEQPRHLQGEVGSGSQARSHPASAHVLGHEAARYKLLEQFVSPPPRLLEGDPIARTLGDNVQCDDNYQDQAAAAVCSVHATLYSAVS